MDTQVGPYWASPHPFAHDGKTLHVCYMPFAVILGMLLCNSLRKLHERWCISEHHWVVCCSNRVVIMSVSAEQFLNQSLSTHFFSPSSDWLRTESLVWYLNRGWSIQKPWSRERQNYSICHADLAHFPCSCFVFVHWQTLFSMVWCLFSLSPCTLSI